jgi:Tfp pilus assembly pilus retraction ATPase PilT
VHAQAAAALLQELLTPAQRQVFEGGPEVDFSFTWRTSGA